LAEAGKKGCCQAWDLTSGKMYRVSREWGGEKKKGGGAAGVYSNGEGKA